MSDLSKPKANGKALIPILVFVLFYVLSGIILSLNDVEMAFYAIPSPISITIGVIVAYLMFDGSLQEKSSDFVRGCGDENIITMCIIYLLAGAFSTVSSSMGGVDSVVNLCLSVIPVQFITAGVFLIACFITLSTGTSVGTVVALAQIAIGVATKGGLSVPLMLGALVGGSMFGDNLSIISDTTIAATKTQNVEMKDKFRLNFKLALIAAIITFILLLFSGKPEGDVDLGELPFNIIQIIPYILVLILALTGLDVFAVLIFGIVVSGVIGLVQGSFDGIGYANEIYSGFTSVTEIFILSMFTGGLANMVRKNGGIEWLIEKMSKFAKDKKSGEFVIAFLTSITDIAVANNTVSIVLIGPIAKDICNKYKIDPRRSASLLDIFSCCFQGLIPYGAQLLIAAGNTDGLVSPVEIVPYVWYCIILLIVTILSIFIRFADPKDSWNYEKDIATGKLASENSK